MTDLFIWLAGLLVGIALTSCCAETAQIISTIAAWALVCGIWQFSKLRFVARSSSVSKMSTDQAARYLRLTVRRILLTLALALVVFLPLRSEWGVVYWLSIASYYQIGIALAIRDASRFGSPFSAPIDHA